MNRASTTNGHPAASALSQGGYDAYFAQIEQPVDETTESGAAATSESAAATVTGGPSASVAPPPDSGAAAGPSTAGTAAPTPTTGATPPPGNGAAASPESGTLGPASASGPLAGQHVPPAPPTAGPAAPAATQTSAATGTAPPGAGYGGPPAAPGGSAASGAQASGGPGAARPDPGAQQQQAGPAAAASTAYVHTGYPQQTTPPGHTAAGPAAQGYSAYGNQGRSLTDPARVPDRMRTSYDNRASVLPPALASPELLADIAAVRQAHLRSAAGMRGALNKVGFNFGLSPAEQRAESRRTRIRRALTEPYQIAVVSVKGGVGRTSTAAALGSTFAKLRPDRVAAVDANPDFGDLSTRTVRHPYGLTLRDLAGAAHPLDSFSAVHAYTAVNSADLAVVASPWNSDASDALSGTEYATGVEVLRRHYNLLLVDCGTGVLDSATDMVLRSSDAVLVVTPATVGGVTGAVATLNWLSSHGFDHLIAASVVAIVHHHPVKPTVDVEAIEKLFASAQRPTCRIPFDEHMAEGGEIDLRMLDKETALAFEELAAGLADDFPSYDVGPAGVGGRL